MSDSYWEIMVPAVSNKGKPYSIKYHKGWDKKVREIAGGLTILKSAKGEWISPEGELYAEKMIPVRIKCNEKQIKKIIDFTIKYYDQKAVLAYEISNKVILKHRGKKWK